jgi:hypothetical protein
MTGELALWPADLEWVIEALGSIPNDVAPMTLKGQVEMNRLDWTRLQAVARSATSFSYRGAVVAFASPPAGRERPPAHSDMMPPRFKVYLELTVRKE